MDKLLSLCAESSSMLCLFLKIAGYLFQSSLDVEVEDPLKSQMSAFIHNHANVPDISALDQKIYDIVEQINECKLRRDFYVRFADNPPEFIQKWLISQSNDLKVVISQSVY